MKTSVDEPVVGRLLKKTLTEFKVTALNQNLCRILLFLLQVKMTFFSHMSKYVEIMAHLH